jgi:hypothetical protein
MIDIAAVFVTAAGRLAGKKRINRSMTIPWREIRPERFVLGEQTGTAGAGTACRGAAPAPGLAVHSR